MRSKTVVKRYAGMGQGSGSQAKERPHKAALLGSYGVRWLGLLGFVESVCLISPRPPQLIPEEVDIDMIA